MLSHAPQKRLEKKRVGGPKPASERRLATAASKMRWVGSLENSAQLRLNLIGGCALHAPALTPRPEHERLARVGVVVSSQDQGSPWFEAQSQRAQDSALSLVSWQVVQDTDQGRRIETRVRGKFINSAEDHVRSVQKTSFGQACDSKVHHRLGRIDRREPPLGLKGSRYDDLSCAPPAPATKTCATLPLPRAAASIQAASS